MPVEKKLTYRAVAEQLDALGIGMQQRRKRYAAPVSQYLLFWSQADQPHTVCYQWCAKGISPEDVLKVGQYIASKVEIVKDATAQARGD